MECRTWRKHSAKICDIITVSDAARNDLVNKLYAASLVSGPVQTLVHGQDAMKGANTLVGDLTLSINNDKANFYKIISVMEKVEQLKKVVEDMRKECPDPNAAAGTNL